jgi:transcriptional regulator with XRE-family HTH domain
MARIAKAKPQKLHFAEKLHELRQQAGQTQEQLAEASGVPVWTIRNYEQGRREPNWKGIISLAAALGVAVEAFAECAGVDAAPRRPGSATPRRPTPKQPTARKKRQPPLPAPTQHRRLKGGQ